MKVVPARRAKCSGIYENEEVPGEPVNRITRKNKKFEKLYGNRPRGAPSELFEK